MGKPMVWTKKEIEQLITARKEGLTIKDIHKIYFNYRTFESVEHQVKRKCSGEEFLTAKERYNSKLIAKVKQDQNSKIEEKFELLLAAIQEGMKQIMDEPTLVGKFIKDAKKDTEIPVLFLSDLHIGERHEGKGEEYNKRIFENRMAYLTSKVIHISKNILSKAYNLPELKIFLGGDCITNEILFPSQPFEIDMSLTEQVFKGAKVLAYNFNELSKYFEKITVYTVNGNHGRNSKYSNPSTSWDYVFYKAIEAATQNNKRIVYNIEEKDFKQIIDIEGHRFMLTHGDRIKTSMGIPLYGLIRAVSNWVSMYIEDFTNLKYFCFGHFHTSGFFSWNKRKIIMNGTLNSGGQFSTKEIKMVPSLSQLFWGVSKTRGITWHYELDVSHVGEPTGKEKYLTVKNVD